ncbi:hypothetical protein SAMN06295967_10337 [Belliella buryatensis]|uniref:Uncharacterized protein n=1 Tax=Belliella buryatensis TaxID=1500549 RepID=A0A239BK23_9BACT|nr:hypothetical protein [Belliella buryatensis]SNS07972.1 hypothetical protein SAMN06295967_10337 [Belliella buryatensis]
MPKNDSLSPEMLKILKIFGLGSLFIVLVLSFFDGRRANNSGKEISILSITDAERLYFKNVRGIYYDQEIRADAKMMVYRFGKRIADAKHPVLNLSILINRVKNEAYIYLEPSWGLANFKLKVEVDQKVDTLIFSQGDKFSHFEFVQQLYPYLSENSYFTLWDGSDWIPILQDDKERDALRIPIKDFLRLINIEADGLEKD